MKAKVNIYRNLHKPGKFSIRLKGKVIDHAESIIVHNCSFRVGEKGRLKVIQERRKNVHAWVVGEFYERGSYDLTQLEELYFDPYFTQHFMSLDTGKKVIYADLVVCANNRCYAKGTR